MILCIKHFSPSYTLSPWSNLSSLFSHTFSTELTYHIYVVCSVHSYSSSKFHRCYMLFIPKKGKTIFSLIVFVQSLRLSSWFVTKTSLARCSVRYWYSFGFNKLLLKWNHCGIPHTLSWAGLSTVGEEKEIVTSWHDQPKAASSIHDWDWNSEIRRGRTRSYLAASWRDQNWKSKVTVWKRCFYLRCVGV